MTELAPYPNKPNCVSSKAEDEDHFIGPLKFEGEGAAAFARLKSIMAERSRTKLEDEKDGYLHYVETTRIMRFKDDIEFLLNDEAGQIEVRSASRVGHSDLGVNRKRVEEIRKAFEG